MKGRVCLLPGDGIGPEVAAAGVGVLDAVAPLLDLHLEFVEAPVGGVAIEAGGVPLPESTLRQAADAHAVLLGAVGGPAWDDIEIHRRPEAALLGLRRELGLFANLRPVRAWESLAEASPLKHELVAGVDLLIVRELTGGVYFGQPRGVEGEGEERRAFNTMAYSRHEVRRIARVAFEAAMRRRRRVTSVDKANVLDVSRLWRETVADEAGGFPRVELDHLYVDNCAMQLVLRPARFDVILTSNLFGDILSDEAAVLGGSIGLLPSASLGRGRGLFEPVHGSAPDIAGSDTANPVGAILSAAMLLRYTFDREDGAAAVEAAVERVLAQGYRTPDLWRQGTVRVGTARMGHLVREEAQSILAEGRGGER